MQWCHTPRASATQRRDEDTRETAGEVAARGPLTMEAGRAGRNRGGDILFHTLLSDLGFKSKQLSLLQLEEERNSTPSSRTPPRRAPAPQTHPREAPFR